MLTSDVVERIGRLGEQLQPWHRSVTKLIPLDDLVKDIRGRGRTGSPSRFLQHDADDLGTAAFESLEVIVAAYLSLAASDRALIRRALDDHPPVLDALYPYARRCARFLSDTGDDQLLRLGLGAVSMEDGRDDYRDLLGILARLWVSAESAGIDPRVAFASVGRVSNQTGGRGSTGYVMGHFPETAVYRDRNVTHRPLDSESEPGT